jgi:rifampicin phosphotransferase
MAYASLQALYIVGMSDIIAFSRITTDSADLVGGKGLSLGLTANAGLPVPPGFCVTAAAYRRHATPNLDSTLLDALLSAYRELGGGVVAVRSSALGEDGATTSFAGQQETILGVDGEDALRTAVERCWRSLHTDRAKAYRERQGVDESGLAMAVVVQRLVDAEVAGVMFTRDPLDPTGSLMRVESAWGLGEAVVSGRVTPDRFQIHRETGIAHDRQAGRKHLAISRHGEQEVPLNRQEILSLTDEQLAQLAELGRQVEAFYGDPRDIEWAIADGRVWLLQARPITTVSANEREQVRRDTIERLRQLVEPAGTVWSRTNLIEVLPEPTPMTWAIVSQYLLSGGGGTGAMYRDFSFKPDPAMTTTCAYDLIGGRPYLNLSREPRLEDVKPLAGYPLANYKANPHLALDPKREEPRGLKKWLRLFGMLKIAAKITSASKNFAKEFREKHIPAFAADVDRASTDDLSRFDPPALVKRLEHWIKRTLVDFARQSLKPTLLAQFSWQVLEQQISKSLGAEQARSILSALSQGAKPDPEADLPCAIRNLAAGTLSREKFLEQFGHRGSNEMELSSPRWAEDPSSLAKFSGTVPHHEPPANADVLARVAADAKWNAMLAKSMAGHVERLQTYLGLRETGKHHLMRGYAIIRQTLLELDRRFGLNGGIFYLTPGELPALVSGQDFKLMIAERRKRRAIELTLEVPPVLFGDDLEAIGRPLPAPENAEQLTGIPLSAGVAEGPALVLTQPTATSHQLGYILVCPSTDPAWVPLFVNARGLVMESGGTLSHGAIVAREFGLPAVAGLPGVQHRIQSGQMLHIDGSRGTVSLLQGRAG